MRTNLYRSHNLGASALGTIFLLVIMIGGVVLYAQNSTGKEPEIDSVLTAHDAVKSFTYSGTTSLAVDLNNSATSTEIPALRQALTSLLSASVNSGTSTEIAARISMRGQVKQSTSTGHNGNLQLLVGSNRDTLSELIDADWRSVEGKQFVRANSFPEVSGFGSESLSGQWYRLSDNRQAADQLLEQTGISAQSTSLRDALSATSTTNLFAMLFASGVLKVDNTTKTELRDRQPAYQFNFSIKPKRADDLRQQVDKLITEDENNINDTLDTLADDLGKLQSRLDTARIWTHRETDRLRRLLVVIGPLEQSDKGVSLGTTTVDVSFSDYNQPIQITPPTETKPLPSTAEPAPLPR